MLTKCYDRLSRGDAPHMDSDFTSLSVWSSVVQSKCSFFDVVNAKTITNTCLFNDEKKKLRESTQTTAAATSSDKIAHLLKRDSIYQQFPVCLLGLFFFCRSVPHQVRSGNLPTGVFTHPTQTSRQQHRVSRSSRLAGHVAPPPRDLSCPDPGFISSLQRSHRLERLLSVTDGIKWGFRTERKEGTVRRSQMETMGILWFSCEKKQESCEMFDCNRPEVWWREKKDSHSSIKSLYVCFWVVLLEKRWEGIEKDVVGGNGEMNEKAKMKRCDGQQKAQGKRC